jgi:multiple sugar transport system ATP-binding protein
MAGVEVANVAKRFGDFAALKGVSLAVAEGEFVSLVGPSGCGKTTLMRIVAGLETPDSGTVRIAGADMGGLRAAERDVAMVFQSYALYPHLTARQNMAVPLVMRGLDAFQRLPFVGRLLPGTRARLAEIDAEIRRTAALLAIGGLLDRKPGQLSGGQRQRVALGRAIVRHPKAFLLDEPLSNLDASLRVQTRKEIVEIHRRVGASTIYVTHDQTEAMTMSDRVAVMMSGEILQIGRPEEIYLDPTDLRVAAFVGSPSINALAADADPDGRVRLGAEPVDLAAPAAGPVTLAIRPEDLRIDPRGRHDARLEHVEFLGESLLIHLRHVATGSALIARLDGRDRPALRAGETLRMGFDPARAFLFGADGRRVVPRRVRRGIAELVGG